MTTAKAPFARKTYPTGAVIFREGEAGGAAYIVETGRVEIVKDEGGRERRIGTIGPGGLFGEMALVDNQPRMATALAAEECCLVLVPGATFRAKLTAADPFIAGLLRLLNGSARQLQDEIGTLRQQVRELNAALAARPARPAAPDES